MLELFWEIFLHGISIALVECWSAAIGNENSKGRRDSMQRYSVERLVFAVVDLKLKV